MSRAVRVRDSPMTSEHSVTEEGAPSTNVNDSSFLQSLQLRRGYDACAQGITGLVFLSSVKTGTAIARQYNSAKYASWSTKEKIDNAISYGGWKTAGTGALQLLCCSTSTQIRIAWRR